VSPGRDPASALLCEESTLSHIERWLIALPADVRAGIEVVSIDPSEAYRHAIRAALPDARIVCDHFHLVRGANTALDAVRRERQREARAKRPKGTRRSGQQRSLATRALPRSPPPPQSQAAPPTASPTSMPITSRTPASETA
jgi:transposase